LALLRTEDRIAAEIKLQASDLEKFFSIGESVRVLQGLHAGEPGIVIELSQFDNKHATVLMENTKAELRVLVSNLRRKEELDPNCKHSLSEFLIQNQANKGIGRNAVSSSISEIYSAGDLVLFDNYQNLGLVL